ncbi:MAG: DMT family transporter [Thermocladium sp.]|jgi:drug/metabolite transporter (DMT)-like permease
MNGKALGYAYLAMLVLIWGTAYPLTKLASLYASPMVISLFRTTLGALLLYPIAKRLIISREMLLAGLLNIGFFLVLLNLSIMLSPNPGLSAVLVYTQPLFLAVLEPAASRRPPPLPRLLALFVGFIGILLTSSGGFSLGSIFALLSGLSWALGTIYYAYRVRERSVITVNASMMAISIPVVAALVPLDYSLHITIESLLLLFLLALLAQVIGFLLWFKALSMIQPSLASSILLLTPVAALISSSIMLRSPLTMLDMVGASITLASVIAVTLMGRN